MRFLPAFATVSALGLAGIVLQARMSAAPPAPLFSDDERRALVAFWNAPGRYGVEMPPDAPVKGPWTIRLTTEGSEWLWRYQKVVTNGRKIPPSEAAKAAASGPTADWEPWLSAKVAYDRYQAARTAMTANAPFATTRTVASLTQIAPAPTPAPVLPPGPIPPTLLAACGNPPSFASAVTPMLYRVQFDQPDEIYNYTDNVKLPERFAYYRSAKGVVSYGTFVKDLPETVRVQLFARAGFTPAEQRIFQAVSGLEGGFETVQTYDTGYLSVGFIQFVTLAEGKHDLSKVMEQEKRDDPEAYNADFRRFGIDIQPDLSLTAVDPATGAELVGAEAVRKVIDDKRLVAVYQRAGRHSDAFRVAQIKVAKSFYWPTEDILSVVRPDGTPADIKIGEIIRSEAGLATLLDRKINTGNVRPLADVVGRVMRNHNLREVSDAALYERDIIGAMKYRTNFLKDPNLGQPATPGARDAATPAPRRPGNKTSPLAETPATKKARAFWDWFWKTLYE